MLKFSKVTINDISLINAQLQNSTAKVADKTLGSFLLWGEHLNLEFATCDFALFIKIKLKGQTYFFTPVVNSLSLLDNAFSLIEEYAKYFSLPLKFYAVEKEEIEYFSARYKEIEYKFDPKWSDYIYDSQAIVTLIGRKYNGQRNFINRFKRIYENWSVEEINNDNLTEISVFLQEYYDKIKKDAKLFNEEREKLKQILSNYEKFSFCGLLLRVNGKIIAISIGEKITNTLFVHIEKANIEYQGAYQMIVNEFAKKFVDDKIFYINREDAAGDEGLIASKKSYHPVFMGDKYFVTIKE